MGITQSIAQYAHSTVQSYLQPPHPEQEYGESLHSMQHVQFYLRDK